MYEEIWFVHFRSRRLALPWRIKSSGNYVNRTAPGGNGPEQRGRRSSLTFPEESLHQRAPLRYDGDTLMDLMTLEPPFRGLQNEADVVSG